MHCPDRDAITSFSRGEMRREDAARIREHLRQCSACADLAATELEVDGDEHLLAAIRDAFIEERNQHRAARDVPHQAATTEQDSIAGYALQEELHRGGQGVVYKAIQQSTNRVVALKVLLDGRFASRRQRYRFEREIEIASQLAHPNIVTVHDSGRWANRNYLVMEYVDGVPLDDYLQHNELQQRQVVQLLHKICLAVNYAHQHGVIHRDLKPANILIDEFGEPHILDFGLAKATKRDRNRTDVMTIDGEFMGTLAYASPEQTTGDPAEVDVRSDVYALGVIAYEALTGQFPYDVAGSVTDIVYNITQAPPRRPSSVNKRINADLQTILLTAIAKDKLRRYQSTEAFARDIGHYLHHEPIEARSDSAWYVARKALQRHRWPITIATGFVMLVTAFAIFMAVMYGRAERESARAGRVQEFLEQMLGSASVYELGPDARMLEVLAHAEQRINAELANEPDTEAAVRYTIGQTYWSFRQLSHAQHHFAVAVDMNRELYDSPHPELARSLLALGAVRAELHDQRSIALLQEAVTINRALYGANDSRTADAQAYLALAIWSAQPSPDYRQAEHQYRQAIAAYEKSLGKSSRELAFAMNHRGRMYIQRGESDRGEFMMIQALQMMRDLGLTKDPYLAQILRSYSRYLQEAGRYDEAAPLLQELLALAPFAYGQVMEPYLIWELGRVRFQLGDYEQAESLYRKSLGISAIRMGNKTPTAADRLHSVAIQLVGSGQKMIDAPVFLEAFDAMRPVEGADEMAFAIGMFDLAEVRAARGDVVNALTLVEACATIRQRHLNDEHPLWLATQSLRGYCEALSGNEQVGIGLMLQSYAALQQTLGGDHQLTQRAMQHIRQFADRSDLAVEAQLRDVLPIDDAGQHSEPAP